VWRNLPKEAIRQVTANIKNGEGSQYGSDYKDGTVEIVHHGEAKHTTSKRANVHEAKQPLRNYDNAHHIPKPIPGQGQQLLHEQRLNNAYTTLLGKQG
jgi:hypothetical protein